MSDEQGQVPEPETGQDSGGEKTFTPEYVKQLRSEAAKKRIEAKELAERLAVLEQERADAAEAKLAEEKRWQELAEKRAKELDTLKGLREQMDSLTKTMQESNEKRVAGLPERVRPLVPAFDSPLQTAQWLDANWAILTQPLAPALDGAAGGARRPSEGDVKLTEAQLEMASSLGLTPDEYAKGLTKK